MVMPSVGLRRLGPWQLPPIGLGAMPFSWQSMLDARERAVETIHAALDHGLRLIDTANRYLPDPLSPGHNEALVAEALATWRGNREEVVVASKAGIIWNPDMSEQRDATRDGLRRAAEASAQALNTAVIDLYYLHRLAPEPSVAKQVENLLGLKKDGLAREVGLSNVTAQELEVALDVGGTADDGGVAAVENEFSPRFRDNADVMVLAERANIAFVAWSPLGGIDRVQSVARQYPEFAEIGACHGATAHQIALAWILQLAGNTFCIPGATKPSTVRSSATALGIELTEDEVSRLSSTVPEGTSQYPDDVPRPSLR
jgi:aryl-alcohol dehydrogenase-like predicted oxidoreductase